MSGRNKRGQSSEPQRFRQVYDRALDGGGTGLIALRGQAVPATWLIVGGLIDIHVGLTSGAATPPGSATVSMGIATVANWGVAGQGDTNNLVVAEALTNNWDSAIPRSFSTGNDANLRDKSVRQIGATAALATITVGVEALTDGRFSVHFFAIPPDGYAGGAI